MKLAHFSDIHLGIDEDDHLRIGWLLGDALANDADHVVIAGDVLDHGNLDDLRKFKAMLRRLELWHPSRLTVIPGNHDIIGAHVSDVVDALAEMPAEWHREPGRLIAAIGALIAAGARDIPSVLLDSAGKRKQRHRAFVRAFASLAAGAQRGSRRTFAHRKRLAGVDLVAIDTTNSEYWMKGEVGAAQREDVAQLLRASRRSGCLPIVVGHHRPIDVPAEETPETYQLLGRHFDDDMNLADANELLGVVGEEGGDLVLCGHWHVLGREEYYERVAGVRVYTQGRSGGMDADPDAGTFYSYDLLTITGGVVRRRTTVRHAIEDIDAEIGIETGE